MDIHLEPASDSGGKLRFVHARRAVRVLGVIMAAGAAAAWIFMDESLGRLMFAGPLAFAALHMLAKSFYRFDLVLDVRERRWRRVKGLVFAPSRDEGSLDDLRGVVLTVEHVTQGSGSSRRSVPMWFLALEFAGAAWDDPVLIGMAPEEKAAYALLEDYARRLRTDAVDRTADDETRRAWDALDRPLAASTTTTTERPADVPVSSSRVHTPAPPPALPPAGSGIEVTVEAAGHRITLPPLGASAMTFFSVLFGLVFGGGGAFGVVAGFGLLGPINFNGEPVDSPEYMLIGIGAAFVVVALKGVSAAISRTRMREWVVDEGDRLIFGATRSGRTVERIEIPKQTIEEIAVRSSTEGGGQLTIMGLRVRKSREAAAREAVVRVRCDDRMARLGSRIPPEAKAWLRDTLTALASARQDARSA